MNRSDITSHLQDEAQLHRKFLKESLEAIADAAQKAVEQLDRIGNADLGWVESGLGRARENIATVAKLQHALDMLGRVTTLDEVSP